MPAWLWLILGVSAIGLEMTRGDLYLLPVGIAALVAALLAPIPVLALCAFILVGGGLLVGVRPRIMRRWMPAPTRNPSQRLIGRTARVIRTIVPQDSFSGLVELDGQRWSAQSFLGEAIPEGTSVEVLALEGIQLVVHPVDQPISSPMGSPASGHSSKIGEERGYD